MPKSAPRWFTRRNPTHRSALEHARGTWLAWLIVAACTAHTAVAATSILDGPFDIRLSPSAISAHKSRSDAGFAQSLGPRSGLRIRRAQSSGAVDLLAAPAGPLSAPSDASSDSIARAFLSARGDLYELSRADVADLHLIGRSGSPSGLRMLRYEQQVDGIPVFGSETRVVIDHKGQVWRVLGGLLPGASLARAKAESIAHPIDAARALQLTLGYAGHELAVASVDAKLSGRRFDLTAGDPVAGPASARQVWFPRARNALVLAWAVTVFTRRDEDWYAVIDASDGALLWRRNLRDFASSQDASFSVYVQDDGFTPAESPAPQSPSQALPGAGTQYSAIGRSVVSMLAAQDTAVSPNGWIDDCPSAQHGCNSTRGNNVEACLDRDGTENVCDTGSLDEDGRALGNPDAALRPRQFSGTAPRDFEYQPAPIGNNPNLGESPLNPDSQRGALVQAFYVANWFHDRMAALGFDEGAGNFQSVNLLGQGGLDGDRISVDVQNSGANAANFSAPADGAGPGRLQLSLHTGPNPDRDSALDAGILVHELSHGMTHRLIGNSQGLLWDSARALGEGWSDFYALALLNGRPGDDPNGRYAFAGWVTYQLGGLSDNYVYGYRRFPYSTDLTVNPLTLEDIDAVTRDESGGYSPSPLNLGARGAFEVHNAGTIWALALWEVRAGVIASLNGDVAAGNELMLQLVTDAIKMTPDHPSFIDARDAVLAADCATHACAHEREIWEGFAKRGLGYGAVVPPVVGGRFALGHAAAGASYARPHLDVLDPAIDVLILDTPEGNGNGRLDPGESVDLLITLHNPLQLGELGASGVKLTLQSESSAAVVLDNSAEYPDIPVQASASNVLDPLRVRIDPAADCGSRIALSLEIATDTLGTRSVPLRLRIGTDIGAGAPVTYSSQPGLMIAAGKIDGVPDDLPIAEDLEIADLDLRIDQLTHPVTGHLSVMLRAPNGYGGDLIWRRGGFVVPNQGNGANFSQVVIDDDLPFVAANDLNQSQSAQAPFSGSWLPAFNSPFWNSYRPTAGNLPPAEVFADPRGWLSRLDGSSSAGRWSLLVANGSNTDSATLHAWSLLITPKSFQCAPFVPTDAVFGDDFESP